MELLRFVYPVVHTCAAPKSTLPPKPSPEPNAIVLQFDPDLNRDNPVEAKHRRLARSHRSETIDRDLKPTPRIRDQLNVPYATVDFL